MRSLPKNKPEIVAREDYYWRPQLDLDKENVPEVADWQVGDSVTLVIEGTVKVLRSDESNGNATVEIAKIGVQKQ